jgi:parallel beta-helix repeat protein
LPAKAAERTILVPDDFPTISDALTNALNGDTIFVKKGTYHENNLTVNKTVQIIGENEETTIVTSTSASTVFSITTDRVTLTGFTIIASSAPNPEIEVFPWAKTLTAVHLKKANYCNISGNTILNSGTAIWSESASFNVIKENNLTSNSYGIDLTDGSTNNTLSGNYLDSNVVGIRFHDGAKYNLICANTIRSSRNGLFFYYGQLNFIVGNTVEYSYRNACHFMASPNNVLHHNNFAYNARQLSEDSSYGDIRIPYSVEFWDDGTQGNFWDDYRGTGSGGVGSTPYVINELNQDKYPLLARVDIKDFELYSKMQLPYPLPKPPVSPEHPSNNSSASSFPILLLSPANTSYAAVGNSYSTVPLTFEANVSLSWVGYSLDGGANVTSSNGTLIEIPVGSQNLTVYANDTAGNWATPQTVYYTVAWNGGTPPEPFPWLPVAAVSGTVVAVVAVAAVVYLKKRKSENLKTQEAI